MPRIEKNGDVAPRHERNVSNPFKKGKHLTKKNDDDDVCLLPALHNKQDLTIARTGI